MTHTLEEGAGDMDATAYAAATEALGAKISFDVGDDALTVAGRFLTENRDEGADLVAAALTHPRFDEDAVARVKGQVQAIIRAEDNDPNAIAQKALAKAIWGAHPYGSSLNGTVESVAPLGREDMIEAQNRVIARDRVIVGATGDITPEQLGLLVDRILADVPETGTAPLPQAAQFESKGGTEVIDWDSPQTVISFAQPGVSMDDPDYFAAFVADHILGGGGIQMRRQGKRALRRWQVADHSWPRPMRFRVAGKSAHRHWASCAARFRSPPAPEYPGHRRRLRSSR